MKEIFIGNSQKIALVDDDDYDMLIAHNTSWSVGSTVICRSKITHRTETMGRLILKLDNTNLQCDHIDRNIFNNQKNNLRAVTHSVNQINKDTPEWATSKLRGVCLEKKRKKWRAGLSVSGIHINLGRFDSEIEAAKAYDKAAKLHHGEFAILNFPEVK